MKYEWLGRRQYVPMWKQLQQRAKAVAQHSAVEIIWICEHEPVYTTGRRGVDNRKTADLPAPLLQVDRGGETTFHGPGQMMLYPVLHLVRRDMGVRCYAHLLEQSCIDLLGHFDVLAKRKKGYPGVWVEDCKIAALGLRVRQGVVFHGMALNINVAPTFMAAIAPCGLRFSITNLSDHAAILECHKDLATLWASTLKNLLTEASR
ncbi:MAG: lipoyl(octanoyl) transferase LipB [Mariprofundaceae bacterium]